jgi:hypothetical protein
MPAVRRRYFLISTQEVKHERARFNASRDERSIISRSIFVTFGNGSIKSGARLSLDRDDFTDELLL